MVRMGIVTFAVGIREFKFKTPLMFETEYEKGKGITLTNKELCLTASGKTYSECDKSLRKDLADMWGDYAMAKDENLTAFGIALKGKLLALAAEAK